MKCIFLLVVLYILSTSKNPCFKIILFSFYRWRNESLKTLIYFSMVTQLLSVDSNLGLLILMPFLSQSTNQIFPEEPSFFHYRKKKKKKRLLQELFLPILSEVPQHGDFSTEEVEGSLKSHKPLGSRQALRQWGEWVREGFSDPVNLGSRLSEIQNITF